MQCRNCGVEVVEQAGFCHKCGSRIETDEKQLSRADRPEAGAANPDSAPDASQGAAQAPLPDEPPPNSTDRFRETLASRQATADEAEKGLWQGGYCSKAMVGTWILSGLITLVLLLIWAFYVRNGTAWIVLIVAIAFLWLFQLFRLCYRRMNIRYELTNQRFVHETGILRRVTDRIEVIDMDDVAFEQSFVERFVGVGTIRISSSDRTHPELVMPGIADVKKVADMIDEIRRNERRRRGLHIESI
ncbi:MAG: PH domain-containing protein [Pirellulales bacterium]|nr:PH domain-containing protein [Pirellulales bacterium]